MSHVLISHSFILSSECLEMLRVPLPIEAELALKYPPIFKRESFSASLSMLWLAFWNSSLMTPHHWSIVLRHFPEPLGRIPNSLARFVRPFTCWPQPPFQTEFLALLLLASKGPGFFQISPWKWRFNSFADHVVSSMPLYVGAALLSSLSALPSSVPRRNPIDPFGSTDVPSGWWDLHSPPSQPLMAL